MTRLAAYPGPAPARVDVRPWSAYRTLVSLFWRLSLREPPGYLSRAAGSKPKKRSSGWAIYALYGLLASSLAFMRVSDATYGVLVTTAAFLMVGMAVAADFASVIVAPGEDEILFHLPLRPRAYLAARLTVAAAHTLFLAACFAALPVVCFGVTRGSLLQPLLLAVAVGLTALFVLVLSFAVYRIALRVFGGPRLRELLAWLPPLVGLSVAFLPQALLRMSGAVSLEDLPEPLLWALPPAWFGSIPAAVLGPADDATRGRALLAVAALVLGVLVLVGALGRGLLTDLQRLLAVGEGSAPPSARARRRGVPPGPLLRRLLGLGDPDAAAGYLLAAGALRQREIRVRLAASMLMPFVLLIVMSWRDSTEYSAGLCALLLGMGVSSLLSFALRHEHHAASWFYGALPIRRPGRFVAGVTALLAVRYVLPAFALLTAASLVLNPDPWLLALMPLAFLCGGIPLPLIVRRLKDPPFSLAPGPGEAEKALLTVWFVGILVGGVLLGLALVLRDYWPWTLPLLAAGVAWLLAWRVRAAFRWIDDESPWTRYGG